MNLLGVDIKLVFALLATFASVVAYIPYISDMRAGKTKPHIYTWLIWCITMWTATAGVWYGGGGYTLLSMGVGSVLVLLMFFLSLKYGTKNITASDTIILILALMAIVVWWQLKNAFIAVLMVTIIDALGYIPSMRKSFHEPWSESLSTWILFSVASFFAILALSSYNFLTTAYIAMSLTANIILLSICFVRRKSIPMPE